MCFSPIKIYLTSRNSSRAANKEAKLEAHDHQRLNENLLEIALKRPRSVNSLTDRDPTRVARERKGGVSWDILSKEAHA